MTERTTATEAQVKLLRDDLKNAVSKWLDIQQSAGILSKGFAFASLIEALLVIAAATFSEAGDDVDSDDFANIAKSVYKQIVRKRKVLDEIVGAARKFGGKEDHECPPEVQKFASELADALENQPCLLCRTKLGDHLIMMGEKKEGTPGIEPIAICGSCGNPHKVEDKKVVAMTPEERKSFKEEHPAASIVDAIVKVANMAKAKAREDQGGFKL